MRSEKTQSYLSSLSLTPPPLLPIPQTRKVFETTTRNTSSKPFVTGSNKRKSREKLTFHTEKRGNGFLLRRLSSSELTQITHTDQDIQINRVPINVKLYSRTITFVQRRRNPERVGNLVPPSSPSQHYGKVGERTWTEGVDH